MEKTTSLYISAYGSVGIVLLLVTHGLWYEQAKQVGIEMPASLSIEPTMFNCLLLSLPVAILAFAVVFASTLKSKHNGQASGLMVTGLPLVSFIAVTGSGIAGSFLTPLASNWVQFLGSFILGGLTAFSHGVIFHSERLQKSAEIALQNTKKPVIMAKWLELEHAECQSSLQWIVWASIIFTTAGLVTWYTRPSAGTNEELFNASVLHAFIICGWASIGVVLGVMEPIMRRMIFLKEEIKNIASGKYTAQNQTCARERRTKR